MGWEGNTELIHPVSGEKIEAGRQGGPVCDSCREAGKVLSLCLILPARHCLHVPRESQRHPSPSLMHSPRPRKGICQLALVKIANRPLGLSGAVSSLSEGTRVGILG